MCRHESSPHDFLHFMPSSDRWFALFPSSFNNLFPPNEDVVLEFKRDHGDLILLFVVVDMEYLVDFQGPWKIVFSNHASKELGHGEL